MATSNFFRNYDNTYEQNLIDDLVIESIRIYGIDVVYISSTLRGEDSILNEDDIRLCDRTYDFEAYVKSVDGFEGEGDFLSKFGLQIRDSVTFSVARRTFERYVSKDSFDTAPINRPKEGDLIYFPLNEKVFKITFVEHESVFYQTGALQVYDMKCELFEYSGEEFQTGLENIDDLYSVANEDFDTATTLEDLGEKDAAAQNLDFEEVADDIIDFSEIDPFSETIDIEDNN